MNEDAEKLIGGNTSTVYRVGNTVKRSMRSTSSMVHKVLEHLEAQGFAGAPRFIEIDADGYECLSYIEGTCEISATIWQSPTIYTSAASLLRNLHNALASFPVDPDDSWGYTYPDQSRHEIICHNDFGLYNLVTDKDNCVGVIDFDLCGPAPRLRDVAYAAYWLVPLSLNAEDMKPYTLADADAGSPRLKSFCTAYGIPLDKELLDMVSEILHFIGNGQAMLELFGETVATHLKDDGHLDHWSAEAAAFDQQRHLLEINL